MIDRHAFASNASSFDTAWRTFGWTPAIRERAGGLEEDVPWAIAAVRADRPARLRGRAADVLHAENFDALHFAFLPLDGRLGFSVWGALDRAPDAPEWRVLTHTLLFDRAAFERMAGFPFALLRDSRYAHWFGAMVEQNAFAEPGELVPLPVPAEADARAVFEQARLREVRRLTDRVLALLGGDTALLESRLSVIYEALAATHAGPRVRRVALRSRDRPSENLLVRLAWITLPLEDRVDVFFSTEQRRMAAPPATLFVLADAEWGQFLPEATRVLDGSAADAPRAVAVGRRRWARAVAHGAAMHARLAAAAELRGWLIIARDDVSRLDGVYRWRRNCRERGITLDAVRELITLETTSSAGRARVHWRAIGHVLARALQNEPLDPAVAAQQALALLAPVPRFNRVMLLRAAMRTLGRGSALHRQSAGFLRLVTADAENGVATEELLRLLDVEAHVTGDLLQHAQGGTALFTAATTLALEGHPVAERLGLLAWPRMADPVQALRDALDRGDAADPRARRWVDTVLDLLLASGQAGVLERLIAVMEPAWLARADVLPRLRDALVDAPIERAAALSGQLLDRVLAELQGGAVEAGPAALDDDRVEIVLRLAWTEMGTGARATALERYADAQPHAAVPLLVQLLCATPPLPLFLALRRFLLRTPAAHFVMERNQRWLPELEDCCPALYARLAGTAAAPAPHSTLTPPDEWKRSASAATAR